MVASQALISGAFSLTRQAVQLGYCPRVTIRHTSRTEIGQIYLPGVNRLLGVACVLLVLTFRSTGNLASAYGIAVTGTMTITTILFCVVARDRWHWPRWRILAVGALFLTVDLAFLGANIVKIETGGWFPIVVALGVYLVMTTWKRGRQIVATILSDSSLPMDLFLSDIARRQPPRVPGTAVFMTSNPTGVPVVLLHHLKHNKVLHQTVVIMSIEGEEIPQVSADERVTVEVLGDGFFKVVGRYGFMETPDVPALLASIEQQGLRARPGETSFYLGRETLLPWRSGQARRLAQAAVHRHGAERPVRHRLLQPATQPGARAGRTDSGVASAPLLPLRRFCSRISRSATQAVAPRSWAPSVSDQLTLAWCHWHQTRLSRGRSRNVACGEASILSIEHTRSDPGPQN